MRNLLLSILKARTEEDYFRVFFKMKKYENKLLAIDSICRNYVKSSSTLPSVTTHLLDDIKLI